MRPAKDSWDIKLYSLGYTITGKTAELTVVQKTIIDTLNQESKTQKVIAKETDCSLSGYSSTLLESRTEGKHGVEFGKTNSSQE